MGVFDVFSKRGKPLPDVFQYDCLPEKFRNQVLWAWRDFFSERAYAFIREVLCKEHGRLFLTSADIPSYHDFLRFFQNEESDLDISLDAIEFSLKGAATWTRTAQFDYLGPAVLKGNLQQACPDLISTINHRFRENGIGYEYCVASGQLIRVNSLAIHQEVVVPALTLLTDPAFKTANEEFLKAHKDFRSKDYGDSLTGCCAAFESTIKIICDRKKWGYNATDTAAPLIKTYMSQSGLPPYFETFLVIIATLRNRLGPHGKGTTPVVVPAHLAKYALHATAAAILLLVDHAKQIP